MHFFFIQKSFWTKNYFHTAEMNLTTRGPLYTCLVMNGTVMELYYIIAVTDKNHLGEFLQSIFEFVYLLIRELI